ncbi:MAG: MASE3 domain-containing protein [Thermodesulfobacteriota bacterium]
MTKHFPPPAPTGATGSLPVSRASILGLLLLLGCLVYASRHNFLLFHTLVELFGVLVSFGIFVIAWNARHITHTPYLLFLGISFLFVGLIDLEHTLTYKGMAILHDGSDANQATQLWIAARYTQSLALLVSPVFLQRGLKPYPALAAVALWSAVLLWAIHAGFFPDCYLEGSGLTPFKKGSEYLICLILLGALLFLRSRRRLLNPAVYRLLVASILFTIVAELAFTFYVSVYGLSNLIGHLCKFVAAYLIYLAIVETGLKSPYTLLFRELKDNEAILAAREAEFRSIFELSAVGMAKVDPGSGRFTLVNRKLCEITGYDAAELTSMRYRDLTHPDDRGEEQRRYAGYLAGEQEVFRIEKRYVRKNGEVIWVRVTAQLVGGGKERPAESIGVVEDITERKQMEHALRDSEEKFRLITQNIRDVVWMSTPGVGRMLYINPAYEELWGRSCQSLYEDPLSFREAIHPDDQKTVAEALRHHAEGSYQCSYRIIRPDGSVRWIEDSGTPIAGDDGSIRMLAGIARDITPRKLLEQELKGRQKELERLVSRRTAELDRTVTQLRNLALQLSEVENRERRRLADILHDDLQQLLAAAGLHLERLAANADSERRHRFAAVADLLQRAIATARSLSHDLSPAILYRGSLNDILAWLTDRVRETHGLDVRLEMEEIVRIDSDSLRVFVFRTVQELLFNVVKHAGINEATVSAALPEPDLLVIEVSDHGRGFEPAALAGPARWMKGTGFGLFALRERLLQLGGALEIDSSPGHGSRFHLRLPLAAGDTAGRREIAAAVLPPAAKPVPAAPPVLAASAIRVLIADDHPSIRQGLASLLREEGDMEVAGFAENGAEAVRLAGELRPHAVILDMAMPDMDGIEATERIVQQWPEVTVIIHSMHEERELADAAIAAGARAYCAKSGSTAQLLAAIRHHAGRAARL